MKRSWPILAGLTGVLAAGGCSTQEGSTRAWVGLTGTEQVAPAAQPRPGASELGAGDTVGYSVFVNYVTQTSEPDDPATRHAAAHSPLENK
jgi:hypothetical protein